MPGAPYRQPPRGRSAAATSPIGGRQGRGADLPEMVPDGASPSPVSCADSRAGNVTRFPRVGILPRWGRNRTGRRGRRPLRRGTGRRAAGSSPYSVRRRHITCRRAAECVYPYREEVYIILVRKSVQKQEAKCVQIPLRVFQKIAFRGGSFCDIITL